MREDRKPHLSTGEFARLCATTKETLFHYDRIGLLKPEAVNEKGYRSYSLNQYLIFSVIWTLKEAGSPLREIQQYIENQETGQLLVLLRENKRRLEQERKRIDHMLVQLDGVIRSTEDGIRIKSQHPDKLCTNPRVEWCEEELLVVTPLPERLEDQDDAAFILATEKHLRYCTENGIDDQLILGCIKKKETFLENSEKEDFYYTKIESSGRLKNTYGKAEDGQPSIAPAGAAKPEQWTAAKPEETGPSPGQAGGSKAVPDENRIHIRPQGYYAVVEHCGAYNTLIQSYRILSDFIARSGFEVSGCAYETELLNFIGTPDPKEYVMRIAVKIDMEQEPRQSK